MLLLCYKKNIVLCTANSFLQKKKEWIHLEVAWKIIHLKPTEELVSFIKLHVNSIKNHQQLVQKYAYLCDSCNTLSWKNVKTITH